jgi:hypothetical protein
MPNMSAMMPGSGNRMEADTLSGMGHSNGGDQKRKSAAVTQSEFVKLVNFSYCMFFHCARDDSFENYHLCVSYAGPCMTECFCSERLPAGAAFDLDKMRPIQEAG